jgi:hypothetical protein
MMLRRLKIWCLTIALTIGATAWTDAVGNTSSDWDVVIYRYAGSTLTYNILDEINVEVASAIEVGKNGRIYIPSEIQRNDTTYYVLGVGDNAFSGNTEIKQVKFEENIDLQYIGEGAFSGCSNLKDIELPSSITEIAPYTFAMCGLEYIEIHDFITKIGERAFTNCTLLTEIYMGENIEEIGDYAFGGCNGLTSFTIPEKVKHLGYEILQANMNLDTLYYNAIDCKTSGAFYDARIERTVGGFEYNRGLTEVIFGDDVRSLPEYLLYNCRSVDSLEFPQSINNIERYALHNTGWYEYSAGKMLYVNKIAYCYKGGKSDIKEEDFRPGTVGISPYCFYDNDSLQSIKIPSSILWIGHAAFGNCDGLKNIAFPYDLEWIGGEAFRGCDNLEHVRFNTIIDSIGKYAFAECKNLREAMLPYSVETMGEGVFYGCESLERNMIPDKMDYIAAGSFSKCKNLRYIKIHNRVKRIEEYAFAGCALLDSVRIPSGCQSIGSKAFTHCDELYDLDVQAKSVYIAPLAFYKCKSLPYVDISGAFYIGYRAFADCQSLRKVQLGGSLKEINNRAFENCISMNSVIIPESVMKIGTRAFARCINLYLLEIKNAGAEIGSHAFVSCKSLIKAELGNNLSEIGAYAFSYCSDLREIKIPQSLETMGDGAFMYCSSLGKVNLPDNFKSVGYKCFLGCENLKSVNLPKELEVIGKLAFAECQNLEKAEMPKELKEIEERAFKNCKKLNTIEIPLGVKKIGSEAFIGCKGVKELAYNAEKCDAPKGNKPIFDYADAETKLTIGNLVQEIDDNLFRGMHLKKIEIPLNVNRIGKKAFADSESLSEVVLLSTGEINIDNSAFDNTPWANRQKDEIVYINSVAFRYLGNDKPQHIKIKEGTTAIASHFMSDNDELISVELPNSLNIISNSAFENCTKLSEIKFPNNISAINDRAFANCKKLRSIELSGNITTIGESAFEGCSAIDSVVINKAYVKIGNSAFKGCSRMQYAKLGDNVESIGEQAFAYCTGLKGINAENEIELPRGLSVIEAATFYNCENLSGNVVLPRNVRVIRAQAFEKCRNIHSIEISAKLDSVDGSAFDGMSKFSRYFGSDNGRFGVQNGLLYSADKQILYHCPDGWQGVCVVYKETKMVASEAFLNCTKVRHVVLNGVRKISEYAFKGCTELRKLNLGEKFEEIAPQAFDGCQNLTQIIVDNRNKNFKTIDGVLYSADMKTLICCPRAKTGVFKIPRSVIYIADYAFYNCVSIENVILHKNIISIGKEAFTGCKTSEK